MKLKNISPEYRRRIWMTIVGVMTTGFSVGMFNFSHFGMDPFQVGIHGIWSHVPIGFGTFYAILNLCMLVIVFLVDKGKIGLGTLINIFLLGYVVEFSSWLFSVLIPDPLLLHRVILLVAGVIILCVGSSLYFTADLGVSTYDAVALIMADKKVAKFQYCRIATDLFCTVSGVLLGATAGIGTLVTAFFMGPVIAFFNRIISIPLRYGRSGVIAEALEP